MEDLMTPPREAIFYEDERVYACLASFPDTKGHSIVAWKERRTDIHELSKEEYEHLMNVVEIARNALLTTLHVEKVYMVYLDETKHVHWHLVPRYNEAGVNILLHDAQEIHDFSLAREIQQHISPLS